MKVDWEGDVILEKSGEKMYQVTFNKILKYIDYTVQFKQSLR